MIKALDLPRMMVMLAVCCIKGCDLPTVAGGMCVNHWRMNKKHGSLKRKKLLIKSAKFKSI